MLDSGFYKTFLECEYILLYQLDAFVFSDELEYFCSLGYDYIGAPWPSMIAKKFRVEDKIFMPRVGNGGFSLRRVRACYDLLENFSLDSFGLMAEDVAFGLGGMLPENNFHVAPINIAAQFSAEFLPEHFVKKNGGKLPFGCHAWNKYSADFWIKTFSDFGCDLNPFRDLLGETDLQTARAWLTKISLDRLAVRLEKNFPLAPYLPKKNFNSVHVLKNSSAMKIFAELRAEGKVGNKIFMYGDGEIDKLLRNLRKSKKTSLIITGSWADDLGLLSLVKIPGGEKFFFFHLEYVKSCENIFHGLGQNKSSAKK